MESQKNNKGIITLEIKGSCKRVGGKNQSKQAISQDQKLEKTLTII